MSFCVTCICFFVSIVIICNAETTKDSTNICEQYYVQNQEEEAKMWSTYCNDDIISAKESLVNYVLFQELYHEKMKDNLCKKLTIGPLVFAYARLAIIAEYQESVIEYEQYIEKLIPIYKLETLNEEDRQKQIITLLNFTDDLDFDARVKWKIEMWKQESEQKRCPGKKAIFQNSHHVESVGCTMKIGWFTTFCPTIKKEKFLKMKGCD